MNSILNCSCGGPLHITTISSNERELEFLRFYCPKEKRHIELGSQNYFKQVSCEKIDRRIEKIKKETISNNLMNYAVKNLEKLKKEM